MRALHALRGAEHTDVNILGIAHTHFTFQLGQL